MATVISTLGSTYAIFLTNFNQVTMFKSCKVLSVILVGVFFSKVKDKNLRLGRKKLIIGVLITIGIIIFKVADPNIKASEQTT